MKIPYILLLASCSLLLASCMAEQQVYVADVDPAGWAGPVTAEYVSADTLGQYDLSVVVRYSRDAGPRAVPVRIETLTPDSLAAADTLMLGIPAPRMYEAKAERGSDFLEKEQPYRLNITLARAGVYQFRFTPLTDQPVEGIRAVGVHIITPTKQDR